MILAVENVKEFHKQNMERNKHHYTIMNRWTHQKGLNWFHVRGVKIHFNVMEVESNLLAATNDNSKVVSSTIESHWQLKLHSGSDMGSSQRKI